ncbi:MAG: hypothetical protein GY861_01535 [bacterium]|nr:hypothetical protein [bacterium]
MEIAKLVAAVAIPSNAYGTSRLLMMRFTLTRTWSRIKRKNKIERKNEIEKEYEIERVRKRVMRLSGFI